MIPNPPWPIRIVPTRWGRFVCLTCGLVMAGTIAALAHAAVERGPMMLYTQRRAVALMSPPRRAVHGVLWRFYWPLSRFGWARRLWRAYRLTWPA